MNDHTQLDALLNAIGLEDDRLEPSPSLESRALEGWDAWQAAGHAPVPRAPLVRSTRWIVPAAAGVAASVLLVLALPRPSPGPGLTSPEHHDAVAVAPTSLARARPVDRAPQPDAAASVVSSPASSPGAPADVGPAVADPGPFVPLGTDVEGDLAGSFRVSRVRVPVRVLVQLGVLEDTHAGEAPVDADVVFGDDGLARAIRLTPISRRMP